MHRALFRSLAHAALLGAGILPAARVSAQTLQVACDAAGYSAAGGVVSYQVTIAYTGTPAALGLRAIAPSEWTYVGTSGTDIPTALDAMGAKQAVPGEGFGWFYFTAPASAARFTVKFAYPAGQSGPKGVAFTALYHSATGPAVTLTPSEPVPDLNPAATAPTISTQPVGATVLLGAEATFTVEATGSLPLSYQWSKSGKAIPGATQSSYTVVANTTAAAGAYTVTVSNAHGSVTSSVAALAVGEPVRITVQPKDTTALPGATATLSVTATGAALAYQWSFNNAPIPGATKSAYAIAGATGAHTGYYQVAITSASDPVGVTSNAALLQIAPVGTRATHALVAAPSRGYTAGATVQVSNTLSFPAGATALGWTVLLPSGFSLASETSGAASKPASGSTDRLEWAWDAGAVTPPLTFTYTLNVPAAAAGTKTLGALAYVRVNNDTLPVIATPDLLPIPPAGLPHSSDTDGDWRIGVDELAQTIALFNTTNNNLRTGAYRYIASETGGAFVSDPTRPAGVVEAPTVHSADTNSDGTIDLKELLQLIDLYNVRVGTERTGNYHWQPDESGTGADRYAGGH